MLLPILLLSAAGFVLAQSDRTLTFSQTDEQDRAQTATVIRSIVDPAGLERNSDSLTVRGSEEVVAAAAWLFERLDQRKARAGESTRMGDDVVQLFPASPPQRQQEIATALRTTLELRRVFTHPSAAVVAVRAPVAQMEPCAWLLQQLTDAGGGEAALKVDGPESVLRVYRLILEPRAMQELAAITRSLLEVRRLLTLPTVGRLVVRGTPAQIRAADWLVAALQKQTAAQYSMGEGDQPLLRLFALKQVEKPQEVAVNVRQATGVRRVLVQTSPAMLAVRGTPEQLAEVEKLLAK